MDQSALWIAALVDHIVPLRDEAIKLKEGGENQMRMKGVRDGGLTHLRRFRIEQQASGGYIHRKCFIVCRQFVQIVII